MLEGICRALFGLFAALAVRLLLPGEPAGGPFTTAALGSAGGWLAASVGERLGLYRSRQKAAYPMSILGAVAMMLLYRLLLA